MATEPRPVDRPGAGPRMVPSFVGQVISGAASSGQQCCTGSLARSTSGPSQTCSWHGAERTWRGVMFHNVLSRLRMPTSSFSPDGAAGSLRLASISPSARRCARSGTPIARITRSVVPNRLPSTGIP